MSKPVLSIFEKISKSDSIFLMIKSIFQSLITKKCDLIKTNIFVCFFSFPAFYSKRVNCSLWSLLFNIFKDWQDQFALIDLWNWPWMNQRWTVRELIPLIFKKNQWEQFNLFLDQINFLIFWSQKTSDSIKNQWMNFQPCLISTLINTALSHMRTWLHIPFQPVA